MYFLLGVALAVCAQRAAYTCVYALMMKSRSSNEQKDSWYLAAFCIVVGVFMTTASDAPSYWTVVAGAAAITGGYLGYRHANYERHLVPIE